MISIVKMVTARGLDPAEVTTLGISKLREIASLPSGAADGQQQLLEAAKDMSVADVQKEAKQLRDKAYGREADPWSPVIFKNATASQAQFLGECIAEGRRLYALPETTTDVAVLVDAILSDWFNGRDALQAEMVEASA
jgi:hypothetical protein